jgi:phospholipase C
MIVICEAERTVVRARFSELESLNEQLAASPDNADLRAQVARKEKELADASTVLAGCQLGHADVQIAAIESVQFPGVFLRMDGSNLTRFDPSGGGTVNCQFGAQGFERLKLVFIGASVVLIGSSEFPNVFLRMDATGLTDFTDAGGGTVNCQFGALEFETFLMESPGDGTVAFRSDRFPKAFLRMDGTGVTRFSDAGGGTVNGQIGAGPFERFRIIPKP